jgi:hypothetical protein
VGNSEKKLPRSGFVHDIHIVSDLFTTWYIHCGVAWAIAEYGKPNWVRYFGFIIFLLVSVIIAGAYKIADAKSGWTPVFNSQYICLSLMWPGSTLPHNQCGHGSERAGGSRCHPGRIQFVRFG